MIDIPQELINAHSPIAHKILKISGDPYTQKHIDRFLKKIEVQENGCWVWAKSQTDPAGYARFGMYGQNVYAHRWVYILFKGTIPEGFQIDHLCRTRNCVNPNHLEVVTQRENILRGTSPSAMNAKKTHCPNSHPYNEENTYIKDGDRRCKLCEQEEKNQRKQLKAEKREKEYLSFKEAREYVHSLEIKSVIEWREYCKSGRKPKNIPFSPYSFYKHEFKGYEDWLGSKRQYNRKYGFLRSIPTTQGG